MKYNFDSVRARIADQFTNTHWLEGTGMNKQELEQAVLGLERSGYSRAIIKAKCYELIAREGRIGIDTDDIFQDKLDGVVDSHAHGATLMLEIYRGGHYQTISAFLIKQ